MQEPIFYKETFALYFFGKVLSSPPNCRDSSVGESVGFITRRSAVQVRLPILSSLYFLRAFFTTSEYGLHRPDLEEDLSLDGFFISKKVSSAVGLLLSKIPEINVSAFARTIGIAQPLMADYISGKKTPSEKRLLRILKGVRALGEKLQTQELTWFTFPAEQTLCKFLWTLLTVSIADGGTDVSFREADPSKFLETAHFIIREKD